MCLMLRTVELADDVSSTNEEFLSKAVVPVKNFNPTNTDVCYGMSRPKTLEYKSIFESSQTNSPKLQQTKT